MKIRSTITGIALLFWVTLSLAQVEYYASNRILNSINKYDQNGQFQELFIEENAGGLDSPQDIFFHPDGFALVSSSNSNNILKFNQDTGEFIEVWNQAPVTSPTKMALGPDNLLYITQWGTTQQTSAILRFNLDGTLVGPVTSTVPTPLGMGMTWDADGNFYVALFGFNGGSGTVERFDPDGNYLGSFIDTSILENPTYIWWDTNGDLLVQDFTEGKVLRYDSTGTYLEDHIAGILNPEGFGLLPNGNLLVVERALNQITEFDTDGNAQGRWDSGAPLVDPNLMVTRDLNLSVNEYSLDQPLVSPTRGSKFVFNTVLVSEIETISVYNYAGVFVRKLSTKEQAFWDARSLADGLYFLVAENSSGARLVQKIMVSK